MDYEKKYKEALEKAKSKIKDDKDHVLYEDDIIEIFPELAESDDERIRKAAIEFVRQNNSFNYSLGISKEQVIAWLEKQGEHANFRNKIQIGDKVTRNEDGILVNLSQLNRVAKPTDKVEPKFKVGDFIANYYCRGRVVELTDDSYLLDTGQGIPFSCEHNAHLWTIQDAKGGDVLAVENIIFIYERTLASHIVSYCKLINDVFESTSDARTCCEGNPFVHPATKEQHDTLMKVMADAGYTFDFEKKELKKIGQKPAWSEEDEDNLNSAIYYIRREPYRECDVEPIVDWLKNKLKSLKDRFTWKPSKKQIIAIRWVLHHIPYDSHKEEISGLLEQLLKLYNYGENR